jgi:preprotein translocase subunit YajC
MASVTVIVYHIAFKNASCRAFFLALQLPFSLKREKTKHFVKIFTITGLYFDLESIIIIKICKMEENKMFIYSLEAAPAGNGGGGLVMIIMLVIMFGAFYFFGIRPQKKQEKEINAMRNGLTVGDEITTIGGIIGKIVSIKDETCVIETTHERTKIRILKSAVSRVDVKAEDAEG